MTDMTMMMMMMMMMWKYIVEPDRPQMTIRRMRLACCVPQSTYSHSGYVILIAFHCNSGYTNTLQVHWLSPYSSVTPRVSPVTFSQQDFCRKCSLDLLYPISNMEFTGPVSSVGIATDYGLDGPGSNPGADEIFRPTRPALGPTQPPVQWVNCV